MNSPVLKILSAIIVVLFIWCILCISLRTENNNIEPLLEISVQQLRRNLFSYIPATDFSPPEGLKITPGTSNKQWKDYFLKQDLNELILKHGWNRRSRSFSDPPQFDFGGYTPKSSLNAGVRKRVDLTPPEDRRTEDLFDIVVLTGHGVGEHLELFWSTWRPIIEKFNLIIIQQGSPDREIYVPSWAQYELYNKHDILKSVGEYSWIFDVDSGNSAAKSFACWVSDKEYIYFLDRNTVPVLDETGSLIDPIEEHLINLLTPSTPYYFNSLMHPFAPDSDFSRGYPHSLRDGVPTAISQGSLINIANYDSATRLIKLHEVETRAPDVVTSIPHGIYFSMTTANIAISRRRMGPLLYFASALRLAGYDIGDKNIDILTGWLLKTAVDHLHFGVKHGGRGYVRNNDTGSPLADLQYDVTWALNQEQIIRMFSSLQLSVQSRTSVNATLFELADFVEKQLAQTNTAFGTAAKAMRAFAVLWDKQHVTADGALSELLPVASRSSIGPPQGSPHSCAVFTIQHKEARMLPLWLQYYNKAFPGAVFVVDHFFNASSHDDPSTLRAMEPDFARIAPGLNVTYWKLFGDADGFPVIFLVNSAQIYQRRLFRAGYKCVMYTDVDEFVAPDPKLYPGGLTEYLTKFVNTPTRQYARTTGFNVGHVSEKESVNDAALEPAMDWTKPILSQRSFWVHWEWYDKPVLSKVPLKWNVGFHTTKAPPQITPEKDLFLLHMSDVDKDYCVEREMRKYLAITASHKDVKTSGGFNFHIWNFPEELKKGNACRFAKSVYVKAKQAVFDNLGKLVLERMDAAWKSVGI